MDGQELNPLKLTTRDFRYDTLKQIFNDGNYTEIFPENGEWSISTLSVYLNELTDWKLGQKFRTRVKNGDQIMKFNFVSDDHSEIMKISIDCSGNITVKILSVTLCAKWQSVATIANISYDKRGRLVKKPQRIVLVSYKKQIQPITDGSLVILHNLMAVFYGIECYSSIFLYFCKKTAKILQKTTEDMSTFYDIYETWLENGKNINSTTRDLFFKEVQGILKFYVTKNQFKNKAQIIVNDSDTSIISGIYISPFIFEARVFGR